MNCNENLFFNEKDLFSDKSLNTNENLFFNDLNSSHVKKSQNSVLSASSGEFDYLGERFFYTFKKVKFLRLKIDKDCTLRLSIPLFYKEKEVLEFLSKNKAWISSKMSNLKRLQSVPKADEVLFLGRTYKRKFEPFIKKTQFQNKILLVKNEQDFELFLRKNARIIFSFYLKKWQKHFEKKVRRVSIKKMSTRWGSCNHAKAYINLNLNLLQKPLEAIEYVILHELTHLVHPHHQASFYAHLQSLMSDYRQRERRYFKNAALD